MLVRSIISGAEDESGWEGGAEAVGVTMWTRKKLAREPIAARGQIS